MDSRGENSGDSVELSHFLSVTDPSAIMTHNGSHQWVTAAPAIMNGVQHLMTDPSTSLNHNGVQHLGDMPGPYNGNSPSHPYVTIVEQPQQRGFRFRYECEGPSHGGLQGGNTERNNKLYPSIRVVNYDGPAQIEVSLVTDEDQPRMHAHKLVGKNCVDGVCRMTIQATASVISFPNLCIQHVTKKKAADVLMQRMLEEEKLQRQMAGDNNPSAQPQSPENVTAVKKRAQELARNMSLNAVRLQFRVFLPNAQNQFLVMLAPVVSQPIYDSKSPGASALKICRIDKFGGCCTGNEEVFLLCEKVQKEDIRVRFVEQDVDGNILWEDYGNFSPLDVHRQYAIVFKTPPYMNPNIERAVNVLIMLQRKSDGEVSEAKAFTYYPQNRDKDLIARKKRKKLPLEPAFTFGDPGEGGGAGGNGMGGLGNGFESLGPNFFGGGGGGEVVNQNYSVILPNGNTVHQLNVLPQTVEQVVKEEFSHHDPAADLLTNLDFCQELMGPTWENDDFGVDHLTNDLEMDAAHSLMHTQPTGQGTAGSSLRSKPGVVSTRTRMMIGRKVGSGPTMMNSSGKDGGDRCKDKRRDSGDDDHDREGHHKDSSSSGRGGGGGVGKCGVRNFDGSRNKQGKGDGSGAGGTHTKHHPSKCGGNRRTTDTAAGDKEDHPAHDRTHIGKDPSSASHSSSSASQHKGETSKEWTLDTSARDSHEERSTTTHCDRLKATESGASVLIERGIKTQGTATLIVDSQEAGETTDTHRSSSGRGGANSDPCAARMKEAGALELSVSEGGRTDEGFSEVSELSSSRGDHALEPRGGRQGGPPSSLPPRLRQDEGAEERPVRVATAVVKRVIQRMTAKTVLALRDFSETGDPRYLLLVQRHLTAIRNDNGDLPVHLAVINNQTAALRHLLAVMMSLPSAPRLINTFNYITQTALHLASIMHQPLSIEMLLHAGADPSLADRNGNTPAHLAVINGSLEGLRSLVKYLRPGVTPHDPFPELNYLNYDGYSPVHLAAQQGSVEMLRVLVRGQADIDLGDGKSGRTALHHAVELDDLPVAGYLLMEANADVNARCYDGNTPLHVACSKGLMGMVALLMTAGALTHLENEEIPLDQVREGEEVEEEERRRRREEEKEGREPATPVAGQGRRGLQPRDYVAGKDRDKILRMLMGDLTQEDKHQDPAPAVGPENFCHAPELADDLEPVDRSRDLGQGDLEQDVGTSMPHKSGHDLGRPCGPGMYQQSASAKKPPPVKGKLSPEEQRALSRVLDAPGDERHVLDLAERLGYSNLVPALQFMGSDSSPSLYLLDYHQTYGSLSQLRESLQAMGLNEALKVVDGHV